MKSKETLRRAILSKRKYMDQEDIDAKSRHITEKLQQLDCLVEAKTILCYLAKADEVGTVEFIDWAQEKGKTIYIPITEGHGIMRWSRLDKPYTLKNGPLGIPVPERLHIEEAPTNAPIIIPCVAFSANGHRIGHGGGYYDRFLPPTSGSKIALAFEVQHVPQFHTNDHDIKMDIIITESNRYSIENRIT